MRYGRLVTGLALIAAAPALHFAVGFGQRPPPEVSLPLKVDGSPSEARLHPDRALSYRAELRVDRAFPHRETECLVGVGMPGLRTDCPDGFYSPEVEWSVVGGPLASRYDFSPHAGGYSATWVSRDFAAFPLEPGATYLVRARLVGASPLMAKTNPRFVLAPDPMESETALSRSFLVSILGIASAIVGAVLLVRSLSSPRGRA